MNFKKFPKAFLLIFPVLGFSQQIENAQVLNPIKNQLTANNKVTSVLFLGDSHIQAGYISKVLRKNFQSKNGNAGRGTVFPYAVANSKGADDVESVSNKAWQTFRSVYDQDWFPEVGALGFVMGNSEASFLEIRMKNPDDAFDKVVIFNDKKMDSSTFQMDESKNPLSDFVSTKKSLVNYTVQNGDTFPELAAKFNVITTRLVQLNGSEIAHPKPGQVIKAEKIEPVYNKAFENEIQKIGSGVFTGSKTIFTYPSPTQQFLIETDAKSGNLFYGFQFLKSKAKSGVVFNTVGVNGATYADFRKYPLQVEQLKTIHPDFLMISLGTNEALSAISKDDFLKNIELLVSDFRKEQPDLPVLLISPTDNLLKPEKTALVVEWIKEAAQKFNLAFLNMYEATGGKGYFEKSMKAKKANTDKVHFLESGYSEQGELIWKALENSLR